MKFVIVGAGLAGSLTARVLERAGHSCELIDDDDVHSASLASSNLYIGSWLKKFSAQGAARGLEVLQSLNLPSGKVFDRGIAEAMKIRHIAQHDVLMPHHVGNVFGVEPKGVHWVDTQDEEHFTEGVPVLCCGHRGAELVPQWKNQISVKVGHAFLFFGFLKDGESCIKIVSPYKHGKLYQFSPGIIYYADSVALKLESYWKRQDELKAKTLERAEAVLGYKPAVADFRVGYRPMIRGADFGLCEQVSPGVWAINGGGKNGMVAYCNAAAQLLQEVGK